MEPVHHVHIGGGFVLLVAIAICLVFFSASWLLALAVGASERVRRDRADDARLKAERESRDRAFDTLQKAEREERDRADNARLEAEREDPDLAFAVRLKAELSRLRTPKPAPSAPFCDGHSAHGPTADNVRVVPSPVYPFYQPPPRPASSSDNGLMTGLLIGDLMGQQSAREPSVVQERITYAEPPSTAQSGGSSFSYESGSSGDSGGGFFDASWD